MGHPAQTPFPQEACGQTGEPGRCLLLFSHLTTLSKIVAATLPLPGTESSSAGTSEQPLPPAPLPWSGILLPVSPATGLL